MNKNIFITLRSDLNSNQKKFQKIKIKRKSKETQINDDIKFQQYSLRSDGEISFTTKICQKKTNKTMNIQEDPLNFNTSLIKLFHSYNYSSTIQIFHQIYKGCKKFVDPVQSKKTETKLKQQNANKPAPLLILGNALKKIGMNIDYTHQSTPFSFMSMLLLSLQIGLKERMIKSIIDFPITKQQFNANTCDATKTEQMKQKIAKIIMEEQNNNHSPVITNIQWVNNQKIISQYYLNKNDQLKSRNQKQKEHKVKEISNQALVNELQLSPSDLDSRGDINFVQDHIAEMQIRAGLPYFQPNGWVRYELNVSKFTQLDGNDKWLRMDGNDGEWAVYFHGLRNEVKKVAKIIIQTQFKAGWVKPININNYSLRKNPQALEQYKKEQKVGRGIYGSPLINEDCLGYTTGTQFGNQQYRVAFQCRIHPEKVYISDDVKSYWIVRDPKYIRRYGLLIGKVQDIEKQKNITTKFNKQYAEFKETKVNLNQQ